MPHRGGLTRDEKYRRCLALYEAVASNPGVIPAAAGRLAGFRCRGSAQKLLPTLEKYGMLLYEDDHDRLYQFVRVGGTCAGW